MNSTQPFLLPHITHTYICILHSLLVVLKYIIMSIQPHHHRIASAAKKYSRKATETLPLTHGLSLTYSSHKREQRSELRFFGKNKNWAFLLVPSSLSSCIAGLTLIKFSFFWVQFHKIIETVWNSKIVCLSVCLQNAVYFITSKKTPPGSISIPIHLFWFLYNFQYEIKWK